ncbi:hypothetical protein HDV06_001831 [Boothiomyces sp. JEL0866]|nr:hypothetical protein HDV06_001831 [Boothiomyces sp. JEL0866]
MEEVIIDCENEDFDEVSSQSSDLSFEKIFLAEGLTPIVSNLNENFQALVIRFNRYKEFQQLTDYSFFFKLFDNAFEYAKDHIKRNGRVFTGIRFQVKIQDPEGLLDDKIIRYRIEPYEIDENFNLWFEGFLMGNCGWKFENYDLDQESDNVTGKFIIYDISCIEFLSEIKLNPDELTMISGHCRLYKNYFVKYIDVEDHDIVYRDNDCIVKVCNEITGKRFEPVEIRKLLWPTSNINNLYNKQIHSDRVLKKICSIYKVNLKIADLSESREKIYKLNESYPLVHVYKLGSVIGIADSIVDNFDEDISLTNEIYNKSGKIEYIDKYIFYDLETIQDKTMDSLPLKDEFNHDKIEDEFRNKETWPKYFDSIKSTILEYNSHDTRLLEQITIKIKNIVEEPITINNIETKLNFNTILSRSMVARKIWKNTLPDYLKCYISPIKDKDTGKLIGPYLPSNPYEVFKFDNETVLLYEMLSQAVIGGRTQTPYNQKEIKDSIQIDARSMYPSQGVLQKYPYGKCFTSNKYVPDKLGIWKVKIIEQQHPCVLPKRTKNKPLDWSYVDEMTTWTTNVSINLLEKFGYKYKVLHGIYWEKETDEYFKSYMNFFYKERLKHKENKDNIRQEDTKIKINALFGSLLQNNFKDFVQTFYTKEEFDTFYKKYHSVISVKDLLIENDIRIVSFRLVKLKSNNSHLEELQREASHNSITSNPNILTCFVLEYSRACLLELWKEIENPKKDCYMVMCDTDSLMFTNRNYVLNKMNQLKLLGKNLGEWGFDFYNISIGYIIKPKFYALKGYKDESDEEKGKYSEKVRVKGVTNHSLISTSKDQYLFKPFPENYTIDFNKRSIDYMSILNKIPNVDGIISEENKKKYLGPKFKHVKAVYEGEFMQCLHFQMRKGFNGVEKKYVVINLSKEDINEDKFNEESYEENFYYDDDE